MLLLAQEVYTVTMQGLSEFINKAMQEWNIPGLAIAIVKDSQIIFCEGFGKLDIEQDLPVISSPFN